MTPDETKIQNKKITLAYVGLILFSIFGGIVIYLLSVISQNTK